MENGKILLETQRGARDTPAREKADKMSRIAFYDSAEWRAKRAEVLKRDRGECYYCRLRGHYSPAVIVHHVQHLDEHPELALSDTYIDADGVEHRQLVSVCRDCHETVCHPERMRDQGTPKEPPLTAERWD